MKHSDEQPKRGEAPSLRELAAHGLVGIGAVFFLVRYASGGINAFWWICLVLFGVGLVSFLRDLRQAWEART